jgi:AcrR family transcriptional regulator
MSKKQGARELLLLSAERLFTQNGYTSVSTRDLADAAGVNLAAIKYHFGSKAKLFVEVIHRLMAASGCVEARLDSKGPIQSQTHAACAIAEYVVGFLQYLLNPQGPQACKMMLREAGTDHSEDPEMFEALISSVAEQFMRPIEEALVHAIGILNPSITPKNALLCARSINGECAFYGSHRIFLERLDQRDLSSIEDLRALAEHITSFSLRGMGCSENLIAEAIVSIRAADIFIAVPAQGIERVRGDGRL